MDIDDDLPPQMKTTIRDYTGLIEGFWPTILQAWEAHADKLPVIECDLADRKVRAYASAGYIDSLSARTREAARREFDRIITEGGIMVFVRDPEHHVLQSYCFPDITGASGPRKPSPSHQRPDNGGPPPMPAARKPRRKKSATGKTGE